MIRSVITQEQKDKMVSDYLLGKSSIQAAKQFGLSSECCTRELLKRGIQPRGYYKYKINHNLFETVDSEEKAYWLGFIVADGNISKDTLSISLKWSDLPHLEKFKKFCTSEHPIRFVETVVGDKIHQKCRIDIGNKKIVSDLLKLGVTPRKTFTYQCDLLFLPESLFRHFWRGVFDGDGCISTTKNSKKNASENRSTHWMINLVNNEHVINNFVNFIRANTETKAKIRKSAQNEKTFTFSAAGVGNIQTMLNLLYQNSSVFLDRKYELYQQCLSTPIKRKNRCELTKEQIESLFERYKSWRCVARELETSTGRLYLIRERLGMLV